MNITENLSMDRSDLHISRSCPCQSIHSSQDFLEKYFIFIFSFIVPSQHIRLMPYHFHLFICQLSSYKGPSFSFHIREIVFPILTFGDEPTRPQDIFCNAYKGHVFAHETFWNYSKSSLLGNENIPKIKWFFPWMFNMNVFCRAVFDLDMWKEIPSEMKVAVCYNLLTMLTLFTLFAPLLLLTLLRLPLLLYWQMVGQTDRVEWTVLPHWMLRLLEHLRCKKN